MLLGCLVAWPAGIWLGHSTSENGGAVTGGRGTGSRLLTKYAGSMVVLVSNVTLAIPTVALLSILPLTFIGFGHPAVIVALAVFAVPPLLANAYTGLREVDPQVRDAALGMGLSGRQLLLRVELPLAVPYLAAGFRTASVQVVATATLAALVNGGGLGTIIAQGFGLSIAAAGGQILAGAFLVAALALLVEGVLAVVERAVTPPPLRRARRRADRGARAAIGA